MLDQLSIGASRRSVGVDAFLLVINLLMLKLPDSARRHLLRSDRVPYRSQGVRTTGSSPRSSASSSSPRLCRPSLLSPAAAAAAPATRDRPPVRSAAARAPYELCPADPHRRRRGARHTRAASRRTCAPHSPSRPPRQRRSDRAASAAAGPADEQDRERRGTPCSPSMRRLPPSTRTRCHRRLVVRQADGVTEVGTRGVSLWSGGCRRLG